MKKSLRCFPWGFYLAIIQILKGTHIRFLPASFKESDYVPFGCGDLHLNPSPEQGLNLPGALHPAAAGLYITHQGNCRLHPLTCPCSSYRQQWVSMKGLEHHVSEIRCTGFAETLFYMHQDCFHLKIRFQAQPRALVFAQYPTSLCSHWGEGASRSISSSGYQS